MDQPFISSTHLHCPMLQNRMAIMELRYLILVVVCFGFSLNCTQTSPLMHSKVPPQYLEKARALHNPMARSSGIIEEGKKLYEGKGLCVRCHGLYGNGKGVSGKRFQVPPQNFRHRNFWNDHDEGELFWIIKNGSPKTGMLEFQSLLTDEEIWKILRYLETFPSSPKPPQV